MTPTDTIKHAQSLRARYETLVTADHDGAPSPSSVWSTLAADVSAVVARLYTLYASNSIPAGCPVTPESIRALADRGRDAAARATTADLVAAQQAVRS